MNSKTFFLLTLCVTVTLPGLCAPPNAFAPQDGDTIVFLGDSITEAASKPEGFISLFDLFCGVNGYEVETINAGISGHKSNQMLERLERDVLAHKPDWVVISCGVNDVWHQFKFEPEGIELPDYKENMQSIIDRFQEAGVKILLLTATPIYENLNTEENKALQPYNEFLRELADEEDLLLADVNRTFQNWYKKKMNDKRLMTTDGVHLNPRGNRIMATEILRALGAKNPQIRQATKRWELVNNMW